MAEENKTTPNVDKDGVVQEEVKKVAPKKEVKPQIKEIDVHKMNIYQKMLAIQNELPIVAKNLEVGAGQAAYKAVGEADVLKAVRPLEYKYGIYSYPYDRHIIESGNMESERYDKYTKENKIKKELFERMEIVYRFVNVDNPTEYIDITTYGDGIDPADKSVGKAMTYGDKYALMKAYKIMTGDDPDQEASGDLKGTEIKKEPLNQELVDELKDKYSIPLEKIATYLKKDVESLTNADLKQIIARKQKQASKAKEGENNGN